MAVRCLKFAAGYLLVGVWMGLVMGMTKQFQLAPVHAHVNLLGWVTLALAGLIYHAYPRAAATRLALWHFWLHNIGLVIGMTGLAFLLSGHAPAEPAVALGSALLVAAITLWVFNLLRSLGREGVVTRPVSRGADLIGARVPAKSI